MTNLLVKLFVKDFKNIGDQNVRTSYGLLSSVIGIIANIVLFVVKLFIGLFTNSISILADAFNNLSDASSSIVSFVGVKMASKPVDKEHCFGHGRIEYISAFIVALLMLQMSFTLLKDSFIKIVRPENLHFNWIVVIVLIISILIKTWLYFFNNNIGNKISSSVICAIAIDARNDIFITLSTIISLIIWNFTKLNIDGFMGIIVAIFILFSGFNIAKDTVNLLIGEPINSETCNSIIDIVNRYDTIIGVHDLIIHKYGQSNTMATLHVEVANTSNIEDVHNIVDKIEWDVLKELNIFLVIHVDPVAINDEETKNAKEIVINIIKNLEPSSSIHDLRIVNENSSTKLMFDLVLPYSYTKEEDKTILSEIISRLNNVYSNYKYIIRIDKA